MFGLDYNGYISTKGDTREKDVRKNEQLHKLARQENPTGNPSVVLGCREDRQVVGVYGRESGPCLGRLQEKYQEEGNRNVGDGVLYTSS